MKDLPVIYKSGANKVWKVISQIKTDTSSSSVFSNKCFIPIDKRNNVLFIDIYFSSYYEQKE